MITLITPHYFSNLNGLVGFEMPHIFFQETIFGLIKSNSVNLFFCWSFFFLLPCGLHQHRQLVGGVVCYSFFLFLYGDEVRDHKLQKVYLNLCYRYQSFYCCYLDDSRTGAKTSSIRSTESFNYGKFLFLLVHVHCCSSGHEFISLEILISLIGVSCATRRWGNGWGIRGGQPPGCFLVRL
jgi:hypothetical protein